MCDMTHSYVRHDACICVTCLIHMCDMNCRSLVLSAQMKDINVFLPAIKVGECVCRGGKWKGRDRVCMHRGEVGGGCAGWLLGDWCVAEWCRVVQCVAVWCSVAQCGAVWCSVLQCVAVWCSVLQYGAVCLAGCWAIGVL